MVVEYIRYLLPTDRCAAFDDAYKLAATPLLASAHCLGYELTRCLEESNAYVLRIEWDSLEGHMRGFRGSAGFREFFRHIQPFVTDIQEMRHYESVGVAGHKPS